MSACKSKEEGEAGRKSDEGGRTMVRGTRVQDLNGTL